MEIMTDCELSILIPARSEMFLSKTISDLIDHCEADTEIIAVLDGAWAEPPIKQHPMVNVIYLPESIGQRAATNMACRLARGKYVAKVDAHCSFDQGFDRKMIDGFKVTGDDVVAVPIMRNLWAFDWKCLSCGWKKYQGPTPEKCPDCGGKNIKKKMMWIGKERPQSVSFCFDSEPHFQYFNEWKQTDTYKEQEKTGFTETMSLQGSFFMCTKDNYWKLNICDEHKFGSWGSQGIEIACKFWLSGGRVVCNHSTWYSHMFRTQGGDFSFPYPQSENKIRHAKKQAKKLFFNNKFENQKHELIWLLDKFWPVKGWTEEEREKLRRGEL